MNKDYLIEYGIEGCDPCAPLVGKFDSPDAADLHAWKMAMEEYKRRVSDGEFRSEEEIEDIEDVDPWMASEIFEAEADQRIFYRAIEQ